MSTEPRRKLEYSDLHSTPDDGKCYQLVRGQLIVTPSPSPMHQRVSRRLQRCLEGYFHPRSMEVFDAPIDLILTDHDVFVPDLVVVANPSDVTRRGIEGAPRLVVEILSPGTRSHDRVLKARRYAELGVEHYWIVDPDARRVECFRLSGVAFQRLSDVVGDVKLRHSDFSDLEIDLAAVWS